MADLAKENAILAAQREYFASDAHIIDRASDYRGMTPEECLAEVIELCRDAEYFLAMKTPEQIERLLEPEPLPPDTIALLERLARARP